MEVFLCRDKIVFCAKRESNHLQVIGRGVYLKKNICSSEGGERIGIRKKG